MLREHLRHGGCLGEGRGATWPTQYNYGQNGLLASLSSTALRVNYQYDGRGNRTQVAANFQVTNFDYDLDGRRTSVTRPNGVKTTYAYDAASQVTSISNAKAGAVLLAFSYGYDANGSRISKTREDGTQEVYAYDSDLRLAGVAYGTSRTVQYRLDALANRVFISDTNPLPSEATSTGYSYNSFNQLTTKSQSAAPFAVTNFAYDNNGNLLSETTGAQVKSYTWDLDNRLRQVTLPSGATNLFDYDAKGLRIRKNDSTGTTGYLLDGPAVLEELGPTGTP